MELVEYLEIIKKRIWIIVSVTIVLTLTAALLSIFVLSPVYEGKVTLIIGRASNTKNDEIGYDDILMYQTLVKTYGELAKSRLVIDETISKLDFGLKYEEMEDKLKVNPKGDTQILEIAVEDQSPQRAAVMANTLSEVFIEKVKIMMGSEDVKIMDAAQIPEKPVKPKILLNIAVAGFLGLMLSLGLVFLLEYLDNTLKNEDDIEKVLGIPVLAAIPRVQNKKK